MRKKSVFILLICVLLMSTLLTAVAQEDTSFLEPVNSSSGDEALVVTANANKRLSLVGEDVILTITMNNIGRKAVRANMLVEGGSGYLVRSVSGAASGAGGTWRSGWLVLDGGSSRDISLYINSEEEVRTGIEVTGTYELDNTTKEVNLNLPIAFHKGICGDNICTEWENQQTCCIDCGCPSFSSCDLKTGVCKSLIGTGAVIPGIVVVVIIAIIIGGLILFFTSRNVDIYTKTRILNTALYWIFNTVLYLISAVLSSSSRRDGEGKKEDGGILVSMLPKVCPYCGGIGFSTSGNASTCTNCGRTFRKTG